ncbi:MAG: thioredoxin fold domain-containing protein [Balneolaceae bacterium]
MNYFFKPVLLLFLLIFASCSEEKDENELTENEVETEIPGTWYSLEEAQLLASENNKKVMVYAEAVWCPYCKQMKNEVFTVEEVQEITEEYFYPVKVDIESEDSLSFRGSKMTEIEFSQGMRITGTPTFIFFDEEGEIIAAQPGFIPEDIYKQILRFVGTNAYQTQTFDEFAENDSTSSIPGK